MSSSSASKIHYLSLRETAHLIKTRQISPIELTRIILDRIELVDPELRSYAILLKEQALADANEAEAEISNGSYRGLLHGIPVAVKDLCYTKGVPTVGGLQVLSDFVPSYDATVISSLKSAGSILLGKLNLTEGAVGGYQKNFQVPVNPWGGDLWTGSSSSGSGVATAAGLCFASLGSDTGGSIRFPAMACGVVGLKPTYGRVSRYGVLPLAESLDHIGPMTRTVADAAIMFEAIAGYDINDPTSINDPTPPMLKEIDNNIQGLRIGFDPVYASSNVDKDLLSSINASLETFKDLGAQILEVKVPDITNLRSNWRTICTYEAAKAHAVNYPSRASEYGNFFRDFLDLGFRTSDQEYEEAKQSRNEFNGKFHTTLSNIDVLACPGGGIPFSIPQGLLYKSMQEIRSYMNHNTYFQFTIPANFAGVPSLSFPCGVSKNGLPHTMQLVGKNLSERVLCRIGHAYQKATAWHLMHPAI